MIVAWTTVATQADADRLAAEVIAQNLAVCVQIEGPISSHYRWEGRATHEQEFRLMFKVLPANLADLETHVLKSHPYDTPEWIAVDAARVGEKYLSWAKANSSTRPL